MKYTAVGVSDADENKTVVLCFDGQVTISLNEAAARKLVDDILSNANYLWPVEEEQK